MLGWALVFITAAFLVQLLGFVETAHTFALLTKVLFWVFVAGFLVSMALHYKTSQE